MIGAPALPGAVASLSYLTPWLSAMPWTDHGAGATARPSSARPLRSDMGQHGMMRAMVRRGIGHAPRALIDDTVGWNDRRQGYDSAVSGEMGEHSGSARLAHFAVCSGKSRHEYCSQVASPTRAPTRSAESLHGTADIEGPVHVQTRSVRRITGHSRHLPLGSSSSRTVHAV
jgi:hypothetical protein